MTKTSEKLPEEPKPVPQPEEQKDEFMTVSERDFVLQFGPKTVDTLLDIVESSFKLFWDGSIAMFNSTAQSSTNNKQFLKTLFDMRVNTQEHQEPPVTLLHGVETESTLRDALMRIKHD